MKMTGNTILVTGGGSGIGRALAEALHAAGNHVIIAGRRPQPLQETAAANPGMSFLTLNVESPDAIAAFAARIIEDHPALNVLINNAGIMRAENLLAEPFDLTDAEAMITTNLLGPIRLTAALLPHFRTKAAATVINVTSGLAFVPLAMTPTYNATKAAMHSYSQSLRFQLRDTSVQVIELVPPSVQTDLMPGHNEDPNAIPLADYISESVDLLRDHPDAEEILVDRVKMLRNAEATGNLAKVFGILNQVH